MELRQARLAHGLSQRDVAASIGASQSAVHRLEAGSDQRWLLQASRVAAAVGLEVGLRAFPAGHSFRDAAHLALLARLRVRVAASATWLSEVGLPEVGDDRAWDALVRLISVRIGIEAETRPTDLQALERRIALKQRDSGVERVILLLSNTRHNRRLVREHADRLRDRFPISQYAALDALARGVDPGGNALILL